MNYLSHYYLFYPDEKPAFVTGLILPDITRTAHKKFRLKVNFEHLPASFSELEKGVDLHFKTDIIFHKAAFFKKHTSRIKEIARQYDLDSLNKYLSFFAHLVFELMIDKILMLENPALVDTFYNVLLKLDRKEIEKYLFHKKKSEYLYNFNTFYNRFLEEQFLRNYIKPDGLERSVMRVFNHTTKLKTTPNQAKLTHFFKATEVYLQPFVEDIFLTVQQQLNSKA